MRTTLKTALVVGLVSISTSLIVMADTPTAPKKPVVVTQPVVTKKPDPGPGVGTGSSKGPPPGTGSGSQKPKS